MSIKEKYGKFADFSNSWTGTIIIVLFIIFFVAQAFVIPSGSMKRTLLIGDFLFVKKFSYGIPTPHIPWLEVPVLPDFRGDGHLIEGERPKRGDIVVFRFPKDEKVHYVKRMVAVGEDELLYQNKKLYIHYHEGDGYMQKTFKGKKLHKFRDKLWVLNPLMDKFPGINYDDEDVFSQMVIHSLNGTLNMQPVKIENLPMIDGLHFNAFYKKVPKGSFYMVGDNRNHSNDSRFWGAVPYSLIVGKPWFIYFSWDDDYNVRWNRIGKFISSIEKDKNYLNGK